MIRILREITGTVDDFTYQPHLYYVNEKERLVWFQVGDYSRVKIVVYIFFRLGIMVLRNEENIL
jgi:hypothetical protein